MLEEIELQVEMAPDKAALPQAVMSGFTSQCDCEGLNESLQRLSELAQHEGRIVHSVEAEDIAEDIDVLISALSGQYEPQRPRNQKRKRTDFELQDLESERPLKLMRNIVNTNNCIRVNQKGA